MSQCQFHQIWIKKSTPRTKIQELHAQSLKKF